MVKRKYRRVKPTPNCKPQGYQLSLIALVVTTILTALIIFISQTVTILTKYFFTHLLYMIIIDLINLLLLLYFWSRREEVSTISIPSMSSDADRLSKRLKRLFNSKKIIDVLKLSNNTRYGNEMPEIHVWIDDNLSEGYIAIENIANWERADREKFEQRVSGILAGKHQRFAIVNSELTSGDSYILFYFEDTLTSQRLHVKDNTESLKEFISDNKHAIRLSKDLIWYSDITPMMSIIARTRAGKSVLAGRYMANLMLLQDWMVEYNSAKYDRYVKEFNGQSDPTKIVERAEYWCS
ncbi:cell division protein FtsK, partial [Streptococcus sp. HMSC067A03]